MSYRVRYFYVSGSRTEHSGSSRFFFFSPLYIARLLFNASICLPLPYLYAAPTVTKVDRTLLFSSVSIFGGFPCLYLSALLHRSAAISVSVWLDCFCLLPLLVLAPQLLSHRNQFELVLPPLPFSSLLPRGAIPALLIPASFPSPLPRTRASYRAGPTAPWSC